MGLGLFAQARVFPRPGAVSSLSVGPLAAYRGHPLPACYFPYPGVVS